MGATERGVVASKRVLPNPGGDVTPDAVLEYARAVSPRHLKAGKQEKARGAGVAGGKRRGRPRENGFEVMDALRQLWVVSDHLCSKRLQPLLPDLVQALAELRTDNGSESINDLCCRWLGRRPSQARPARLATGAARTEAAIGPGSLNSLR